MAILIDNCHPSSNSSVDDLLVAKFSWLELHITLICCKFVDLFKQQRAEKLFRYQILIRIHVHMHKTFVIKSHEIYFTVL